MTSEKSESLNKKFALVLLAIIVLFGFGIRLYKLSEIPPGFFADEAVIGVDAYTLLINGTDHNGEKYPLFFRAFNDFRGPSGVYTAMPFIALFGLTEFSVRLASVVLGTACILVMYFLVMQILRNHPGKQAIALISSFFLAISPWHFHFSRTGWGEFMPYVLLMMLAVYFFFKAEENEWWLPVSFFTFGLAAYTYAAARIFVPLFGVCFAAFNWRFLLKHKKAAIVATIVLVVILTPFVLHHLNPVTLTRWNAVNIFSKPSPEQSVFDHIMINYLDHFSPNYLFMKGDEANIRHSVRGMGLLYLFQLPLIVCGIAALCNGKYKYALGVLAIWTLLYPLGNAFTNDRGAQAMRSLIGMVPFQIFSAIGLYSIFSYLSNLGAKSKLRILGWIFAVFMAVIIALAFTHYLKLYFVEYPTYSSGWMGWQYGPREILTYFMSVEDQYDALYMAPAFNGPDIFFPFYTRNYEKGCKKCRIGLIKDWYDPNKRQLYAMPPEDITKYNISIDTKKIIYYPTGGVAFLIGEAKKCLLDTQFFLCQTENFNTP